MLRAQVTDLISGSIFLFIGLIVCVIAAMRRQRDVRVFVWLGLWSAMYGALHLSQSGIILGVSPRWIQIAAPYVNIFTVYLMVVAGLLSFMQLSLGRLRLVIGGLAMAGLAIGIAGIGFFVFTGSTNKLMLYNSLLAVCALLLLTIVVAVPGLSSKYLVLPNRGVLAAGTFVFAIGALYTNLSRQLGFNPPLTLDHLGFAILLFSFGYGALKLAFSNERRLLAVENELEIARQIQTSILPERVPEVHHLNISAAYRPMTAVAGDFYDFIPVDEKSAGILVADVSGHGVPAALIASMIKVAMHSVVSCAHDPRAVLCGLNRIISGQLRGQFVSAAYLWLDMEHHTALYSAAGHPPLLRWRQGELSRIESNGLLFGVIEECDDYPVCTLPIEFGDRLLLYTDGVVEPENAAGESFDERKLEQVIRENQSLPASEMSDRLLSEVSRWQPASRGQQDDITLIVVDVI